MKGIPIALLAIGLMSSCVSFCPNIPIYLLNNYPRSYEGRYIKVVGKLEVKHLDYSFPPFYTEEPVLCNSDSCIYVYSPTNLSVYIGKHVEVEGRLRISKFNFSYLEILSIREIHDN